MRRRALGWIGLVLLILLDASVIMTAIRESSSRFQNGQSTDSYASDHEHKSFWQQTTDDPVAVFTLVLTVATVVSAWSTFYLWRVTERLVSSAEDTARRQLRAYVSVSVVTPAPTDLMHLRMLTLSYTNHGQTPAHDVQIKWTAFFVKEMHADTIGADQFDNIFHWSSGKLVLHPEQQNSTIYNFFDGVALVQEQSFCIAGKVTYKDFRDIGCCTRFRFRWRNEGISPAWHLCATGNEAD